MPPRLNKRQQRELEEISALASGPLARLGEAPAAEEATIISRPSKATPSAFALVLRSSMETINLSDKDRQLATPNEGTGEGTGEEDNEDVVGPRMSSTSKKKVI